MSWLYLQPPHHAYCDYETGWSMDCNYSSPAMLLPENIAFVSIQLLVAICSLGAMIPCVIALIRTSTMHANVKALLILSSLCSIFLLLSQIAVFIFDIVVDNLQPESDVKERWFLVFHNIFYFTTSCLSLVILLERCHACRRPAAYEKESVNYALVVVSTLLALVYAVATVYLIYWEGRYFETIAAMYAIEATVMIISGGLYFYSLRELRVLPFDSDRLSAKYQMMEILEFSRAIVPAVSLSALLKSASLVPTILWQSGIISYALCCLFYFVIHALNCIAMKAMLFWCHRALFRNLQKLFCYDGGRVTPLPASQSDKTDETNTYFDQLRASWNA